MKMLEYIHATLIVMLVLPVLLGINGVWLTLPLTEAIVALIGIGLIRRK